MKNLTLYCRCPTKTSKIYISELVAIWHLILLLFDCLTLSFPIYFKITLYNSDKLSGYHLYYKLFIVLFTLCKSEKVIHLY